MNGRARSLNTVENRTNVGGGDKKQGIPPTVGLNASVSAIYRNRVGCICPSARNMISTTTAPGCSVGCRSSVGYR
jgi:hypothetical protein